MQSPSIEIHAVIELVYTSISPEIQKAAVSKYFSADAGFRHPLYTVEPGPHSREALLGIYQWYRTISPKIQLDIKDVVYDRLHNIVFVDLAQLFYVRFSPFRPIPCRILSRFTLRKNDGVHYICLQEDFLHPDDLAALLFPPLAPILRWTLSATARVSNIGVKWAQSFGIWCAHSGVDHVNVEDIATKPVKPRPGEGKMRQKERRELARSIKRSQLSLDQNEGIYTTDFDVFEMEQFSINSEDSSDWSRMQTPPRNSESITRTNGKRFSDDLRGRSPYVAHAVALN